MEFNRGGLSLVAMECCFAFAASSDGTFVDDGSGAVKAKHGQYVVQGKSAGDSPVNARFTKELASGSYFEVKVAELKGSSVFIGVGTEEGFKQGYRNKGLYYGGPGNLSDGSAASKLGFGDSVEKGDIIGVLLEKCRIVSPVAEETITLTLYHNKRCLGPAFVSQMAKPGSAIYPIVCSGADGDKFMLRFCSAPVQRLREPKKYNSPYEGDWALTKAFVGPELREFPLATKVGPRPVTMHVETKAPGVFMLSLKVANNMNFSASSAPNATYKPFDECKIGPGISTRMMPLPGRMGGMGGQAEVENELSQNWMPAVHKWLARPGNLLLQGPTVELSFDTHNQAISPVDNVSLV